MVPFFVKFGHFLSKRIRLNGFHFLLELFHVFLKLACFYLRVRQTFWRIGALLGALGILKLKLVVLVE
jgi:hypothetical protein